MFLINWDLKQSKNRYENNTQSIDFFFISSIV